MSSAAPEISWPIEFFGRLRKLAPADSHRVLGALELLAEDPDHPSLNIEKLAGRAKNFWSIRASQSIRVLLVKEGNLYCAVDVGPHDELYARAERSRFVADPRRGIIKLVTLEVDEPRAVPAPRAAQAWSAPVVEIVRPLDHWSNPELIEAGFSQDEISQLRECADDEDILALAIEVDDRFELALELVSTTPDQWRSPAIDEEAEAEERLRVAVTEHGALSGFTRFFSPEEIGKLAAAPIEDWMIFLHPQQESAINKRYDGPARIRGAAGTGKTVVALHRTAALADRFRDEEPGARVLFTTFIKSLPPVFEHLYERLPNSRPDEVEFVHIDKLASRICAEDDRRPTTSPRDIDAAFATAYRRVVTTDSPLAGFSRNYLREEIAAVIKGRGLASLDDYLNVTRSGRRTRFTEPMRQQVWGLKDAYAEELANRGTVDFADVILMARDHARRRTQATFRAAIIDEAQDLTLVGLQLIRALATDPAGSRPDSLLIVGDGAQRIYAGGFTLRQAGIEVRGRTVVLRHNYRNTAEILAAAQGVAGDEPVEDLAEDFKRAEESAETGRSGLKPRLLTCTSDGQMWDLVATAIAELVAQEGVEFGDVGVFVPTNAAVTTAKNALEHRRVPTLTLDRYEGIPTPHVKIGTYFRAKGLEFKAVLLPGLNEADYPRPRQPDQSDAEYEEYHSLAIGQLFVAMTRARDVLQIFSTGTVSHLIAAASDSFEESK